MAKISFANMKAKGDTSVKEVEVKIGENNFKIEVLQYLPIKDKYDLVMISCQQAEEDGIYNEILFETYFALNLVYEYANISFTDKQKDNPTHLYDILESNGIIDAVVSAIPEDEIKFLQESAESIKADRLHYGNSAGAIIAKVINDLPAQAAAVQEIVNNFEPSKYQAVMDFAQAANGGRPLNETIGDDNKNIIPLPMPSK